MCEVTKPQTSSRRLLTHHLIDALLRGVVSRACPRLLLVATEHVGFCFSTARDACHVSRRVANVTALGVSIHHP